MNDEVGVNMALEGLRTGLEADGYRLQTSWRGTELQLRIVAGANACEDCLVPKNIMADIAIQMLSDGGISLSRDRIALEYPADADGTKSLDSHSERHTPQAE